MKYKTVLFDFDGTLVDSSRGILNSARLTLADMGRPMPGKEMLKKFIGPPLKLSFVNACGMDEETASEAVRIYREKYAAGGMFEIDVYPGIRELLQKLNAAGITCAVASVKREQIVRQTLTHLNLANEFAAICGASGDINIKTKGHIIKDAALRTDSRREECLMVGDSDYDAVGSGEAGVDFCAVLWGFGFETMQDVSSFKCRYVAQDVAALENFLLK